MMSNQLDPKVEAVIAVVVTKVFGDIQRSLSVLDIVDPKLRLGAMYVIAECLDSSIDYVYAKLPDGAELREINEAKLDPIIRKITGELDNRGRSEKSKPQGPTGINLN
jgi:hypothetical protein